MGLRLIIEDVEGATTIVPLAEDEVTIGRKGGNTIQLTEQNVSRNHARLCLVDGEWEITDLESYNGVLVNGAPISAAITLHEGDLIQIGDYHLVLADELDKRTVDIEHPQRAANDDEPVLASSSADLPKLSPAELMALRSGPQQAVAAAVEDDDEDDDEAAGGMGLKVVLIAAVLGVIGGAVWMSQSGSESGRGNVAAKDAEPAPQAPDQTEPAVETEAAVEPGATEAMPSGTDAQEPLGTQTDEEGTGDAAPPPPAEEELEPANADGAADPGPSPSPGPKPKPKSKKSKKSKKAAAEDDDGGVPPPPSGPARSPKQLLSDARKASVAGDASTAYSLAKEAYQLGKSADALQLMGVSACKMGDATKARSAYKKLSGSKKSQLASLCAAKGIEL